MNLLQNSWVQGYLAGCVFLVLLTLFKFVILLALGWLTKGNILRKNLQKVGLPEDTIWEKVLVSSLAIALEAALSWVAVLFELWRFAVHLLEFVRELFMSVPEEIQLLRFPLRHNPELSREAVWAYVRALEIKGGSAQPTADSLLQSLQYLRDYYPSMDSVAALNHLNGLKTVNPEVISGALKWLSTQARN